MTTAHLHVARDGYIATITLNRPEKLNALDLDFWGDIRRALDHLTKDRQTRVVILTGAGEKAFCAGGDIAAFTKLKTIKQMHAYQVDAMAGFSHLERSPLIIIAAVNGLAFGGGCELALASDIVIAADTATFSLPESALGLVPGFGVLRAPEVVGRQMAKYLIATGDRIDAQRAREIGLVQMVVPKSELMAQARAVAERIAARSPLAVATAKRMINRTIDRKSIAYSVKEITALQGSADRAEGVAAFLEKRAPAFKK